MRKAIALPFFSFFMILLKATREASSIQTWTNSQPTLHEDCSGLSIAGDAMTDPIELAELFDVDVDQFAWMVTFISTDRFGRLKC